MADTLIQIPQGVWRALAAATLLAGAFVPSVRHPELTMQSILESIVVLSFVALVGYWFVRFFFGFLFSALGALSKGFSRGFLVFCLVGNLLGVVPLLMLPFTYEGLIHDPAVFAGVPACVLGLLHLLRLEAGNPLAAQHGVEPDVE